MKRQRLVQYALSIRVPLLIKRSSITTPRGSPPWALPSPASVRSMAPGSSTTRSHQARRTDTSSHTMASIPNTAAPSMTTRSAPVQSGPTSLAFAASTPIPAALSVTPGQALRTKKAARSTIDEVLARRCAPSCLLLHWLIRRLLVLRRGQRLVSHGLRKQDFAGIWHLAIERDVDDVAIGLRHDVGHFLRLVVRHIEHLHASAADLNRMV